MTEDSQPFDPEILIEIKNDLKDREWWEYEDDIKILLERIERLEAENKQYIDDIAFCHRRIEWLTEKMMAKDGEIAIKDRTS